MGQGQISKRPLENLLVRVRMSSTAISRSLQEALLSSRGQTNPLLAAAFSSLSGSQVVFTQPANNGSALLAGGVGRASSTDVAPNQISGIDYLRDPKRFKGMAFTLEERQTLGIHGLLPARIKTLDEQAENCMRNLRRYTDPLNQYMCLMCSRTGQGRMCVPSLLLTVSEFLAWETLALRGWAFRLASWLCTPPLLGSHLTSFYPSLLMLAPTGKSSLTTLTTSVFAIRGPLERLMMSSLMSSWLPL